MRMFLLCIYIAGVIIFPVSARAVTTEDLLTDKDTYDQKTVCVSAEVLEVMPLDKGAWINIGDQGNSLGLWFADKIDLPIIKYKASYTSIGDIVEACGTFYKSSKEKQGELLLDVKKIKVLKVGHELVREVSDQKKEVLNRAAIGLLIVILLFIIKRYFDGRRTKKNSNRSFI